MPKATKGNASEANFSDASKALDEIISTFRTGDLPLEEALALFEKGVGHLKVCQSKLGEAKGSVEELVKTLQAHGESVTRPYNSEE